MFKKSPSANSMLLPVPAVRTMSSALVKRRSPVVMVETVKLPLVALTFDAPTPSMEKTPPESIVIASFASMSMSPPEPVASISIAEAPVPLLVR